MNLKLTSAWISMIFVSVSFISYSQTAEKLFSVNGIVTDSVSQKPLEYVTVSLKTADNKPVKTILTSAKGGFNFTKVVAGNYVVTIVSVGYQSKTVPLTIASGESRNEISLGTLALPPADNKLNEVTITAERPIIQQEVDRLSYDVQADPESKVNTVLDMLRKVPLISLDAEDNIQVKGSSNFKVLINGKPSSLVARDPKEVFRSMPAANIVKIEVITTPPAKYDSEGLAGIINIITNTRIDNGYNASLGIRRGEPANTSGNASLTFKNGKFGAQGYGGIYSSRNPSTTSGSSRASFGDAITNLVQSGSSRNKDDFGYGEMELSYEIDSLNLITGSIGYNNSKGNNESSQYSNLYNGNGDNIQSYILSNNSDYSYSGFEVGLNYQLGFKRNKEQLLTGSYKYVDYSNGQDGSVRTNDEIGFPVQNYRQDNDAGSAEQTWQLDYVHPVKNINIEGGIKAILRDNFSNYHQLNYDDNLQEYIEVPERSNDFDYQQDVYGVYNSYQLKLKNWGVKAGMRLERTVIDADFASSGTAVRQRYNNFIPTVSVQRKFNDMSSLNLGYTQRIQRPGIWQLNPFVNQNDPRFIYTGNPELEAALNHSFELSYSKFKKGSVNVGLSYSFANNTVENVVVLREDSVSVSSYQNIGKNKNLGSNISINYPITQKLSFNLNGRLSYIWIKGMYNGQELSNDGVQGNLFTYIGYQFGQGWRASINGGFFSPWIRLQGRSNNNYFSSFSLNKEFLNKKATVSLSASNPWSKFRRWENETAGPNFSQNSYNNFFFRRVNLGFNYRFGKLQSEIKKNRRGISNDDVKSGDSGSSGSGSK